MLHARAPLGVSAVREAFRFLAGHERNHTPLNEYLLKRLSAFCELLVLGDDLENAFDRFEVLYALEHAHLGETLGRFRAPAGRYA